MIITCSQCQTRFKVGDDKLASGPIRVRCSKCNFVFMATSDGAGARSSQPPSMSLPPTSLNTLPPHASFVPPMSPTPRPVAGPITGMFQAFPSAPEVPSPSGFGSASNRSGIFKAPASDFRSPPNDPFAALAPPPPPPMAPPMPSMRAMTPSASLPPLAAMPPVAPPQAADPFAGASDSFGRAPDPFAVGMTPTARDPRPDPFANYAPPTAPDPFASPVPTSDPFAAAPTAAATPHAKDPFGLGAPPSPSLAPAFAPPPPPPPAPFGAAAFSMPGDATSQTESHDPADLFGAGANLATDPFGGAAPSQNAAVGNAVVEDPFGALDVSAGSIESMTPTGPPGPPPEESDPFADLDLGGSSAASEPIEDPFDRPPPKPVPARPPPSAGSRAPAVAAPSSVAPVPAPADRAKLQRLEAAQRVRAVAWGAVQLVIFVAFLTVAVVLGRGGTIDDLLRGDVAAALGGPRVDGDLAIEHPRVKKRTLPSGLDIVIVSGEVHNTTQSPVPGVRVEVRLGAAPAVAGWAWSTLDGVDLAVVAEPAELTALVQRTPSSASLAPGERAPFVVVAPAPAEGLPVSFSVQALAPPPAPVPPGAPPAP